MNKAFAGCLVAAIALAAALFLARRGESAGPVPDAGTLVTQAADGAVPVAASMAAAVSALAPASVASTAGYAGGPVDIRTTTAKAVVDFALQGGGVESQLQAFSVLVHCLSIRGMNEPTVYDGKTMPPYSTLLSERRRQMLAQYEKFCGNSYKGRAHDQTMRAITAKLAASPDYAKDIHRMWSDKPWTLEQAQAAIQALSNPAQHPSAVHAFMTRAVRNEQLNSLAGRVIVYRELTGDHDPYSAINAFLCLNNDVCDTSAQLALKEPRFAEEANVFLQRVRRQDWRALGLQ